MTPDELEAVGLRVKPLEWGEERQPDDKFIYDHVFSDGPYPRYFIAWKSWKPEVAHCCWLDMDESWFDACKNLSEAKAACEAHHATRIAGELERIEGDTNGEA